MQAEELLVVATELITVLHLEQAYMLGRRPGEVREQAEDRDGPGTATM